MTKKRSILLVVIAALFIAQGMIHSTLIYPRWKKNYSPNTGDISAGSVLDPDQLLFALVGLREFVAGILWVRADSFFDTGNYDAILPIINVVTWLDPKQIDVYATGMWHIGYNFTDEEQRSDRRYIPSALALGKQGARQNPDTYEIFFELGWMWFHKIDDDYQNAVKWFEEAHKRPDILPARRNLLNNAYLRNGQIDKALALMLKLRDDAAKVLDTVKPGEYAPQSQLDTIESNLDNMLVRMVQRGWAAQQRGDGSYPTGGYDTLPPFDVGLSAKVTVEDPKVLKVEGTWNVLPVGTRVRVVLRDVDYDTDKNAAGLAWDKSNEVNLDPERSKTYMQDALFVKNQRFGRRLDLSKDPTMYPFLSKNYIIEFYYNPRSAPAHIQDKFGYNGEGMTDKNYINSEVRPGQKVVYAKIEITQDQLLRQGEWLDKVPVVTTPNYRAPGELGQLEDIIVIPSVRSGGGQKK